MWFLMACASTGSGLETPFTMRGDGVVVHVEESLSCQGSETRIGVYGPTWSTEGEVVATVVPDDDGSTWLHFPVITGLGEAVAALRVEGGGGVIPLGSRPGEFEIQLQRTDLSVEEIEAARVTSAESVELEKKIWQDGSFLLQSGGETLGEVRFRGDLVPAVSVHDQWWLTPRPVDGKITADGAELLVEFDAEPSFRGESALLRINVPSRQVVVPIGKVPVPEERRFVLAPGYLEESERRAAIERAMEQASEMEVTFVEETARSLARVSYQEDGQCVQLVDLDESWSVLLEGYDVQLMAVDNACAVGVEPTRSQHGRRYKGVIQP
jgi:hypothetical protein